MRPKILDTKNFYSGLPTDAPKQPEAPEQPGWFLKVSFCTNILAIIAHLVFFIFVLFQDASPVLITHVSHQIWRNVTNTSFVEDTCSNHSDQLIEKWGDMQLYPVMTESGGVNVKNFCNTLVLLQCCFPSVRRV